MKVIIEKGAVEKETRIDSSRDWKICVLIFIVFFILVGFLAFSEKYGDIIKINNSKHYDNYGMYSEFTYGYSDYLPKERANSTIKNMCSNYCYCM